MQKKKKLKKAKDETRQLRAQFSACVCTFESVLDIVRYLRVVGENEVIVCTDGGDASILPDDVVIDNLLPLIFIVGEQVDGETSSTFQNLSKITAGPKSDLRKNEMYKEITENYGKAFSAQWYLSMYFKIVTLALPNRYMWKQGPSKTQTSAGPRMLAKTSKYRDDTFLMKLKCVFEVEE